ncbi:MAG: HWE histidine kinase domain-containing protein, partial [Pseudomonadota bacterium]
RVAGSSVDEFARVLNGRIAALARAHDQLTERSWTPTSLKDLISVEGAAFGDAASERILLRGDDVLLNPEAFSCLALVSHELVTNSVKYGALSTADGTVNIDLERLADGRLELMWQETGGPAVQIPQRKGFGTSIIEHSVPFELRGEASLQFRTTGVEARLVIPSTAFMQAPGDEVAADAAPRAQVREVVRSGTMPLWGDVLLVEDSLVIALETEERLYALGAGHVHSVSAVSAGKKIAETHEITLAVLDVNLGNETSAGLARWLREHKIPFVLATGYGEAGDVLASYPKCPVLKKPYSEAGLEAGIQMALTEGVVET